MQAITVEQRTLLTASPLRIVDCGAEVLNLDLTPHDLGDIASEVADGSISYNSDADIHRTCTLELAPSFELDYPDVLVKPYTVLASRDTSATFYTGVFYLSRPETPIGTGADQSVSGNDRLAFLHREVAADYTLAGALTYYDAFAQVFADAGLTGYLIDGAARDYTLPAARTWPLVARSTDPDANVGSTPVTWLRVLNDLLTAINFRGVWCDENGFFRCQQYLEPSVRPPEFTFNRDDPKTNIIAERTVVKNRLPYNRWVAIATNPPEGVVPSIGNGYVVELKTADHATAAFDWPKVYEYEVASPAVLAGLAARRMAADLRGQTLIRVDTGEFPVAGHNDIFTWVDAAAGGSFKVQARQYDFNLKSGNVRWTWEVI